jgi:hypothetical protein
MKYRKSLAAFVVTSAGAVMVAQTPAPLARAVPGPEVEYVYNVMVRRHYDFRTTTPSGTALGFATNSPVACVTRR